MRGSVLVIGSGIAGMRASAELLQQQFRVYLVEEGPRIGGGITDERLSCARIPLIQEITSNPNITILSSAEVQSIDGQVGDFTARVLCRQSEHQKRPKVVVFGVGTVIVAPERQEIGESVVQACAAAARAAALLAPARGTELVRPVDRALFPVDTSDEPRIAALIEQGGADVADLLDWDQLAQFTRTLPDVEHVEVTPSAADGSRIKDLLITGEFNRLIVAGPSPITHEQLFQRQVEAAGLNRHLLEMVNLHDQCARVHSTNRTEATAKAQILLAMGVVRARRLEPLEDLRASITQSCLVVGGGASGLACAATLAAMGLEVHLVEAESDPQSVAGNDHPLVRRLLDQVVADSNVEVHSSATPEDAHGYLGRFTVTLLQEDGRTDVDVGAIVVATNTGIAADSDFASALALERDDDGLFVSTQGILNLLDFTTAGVFNCGPARAVLSTEEAIFDGEAAASRAACVLSSEVLLQSPVVSNVVDANCDGCAYCVEPCPTRSITLLEFMHKDELKKIVEVNETTCIGCGICMATCPKKGIFVSNFRSETFLEMAKSALEPLRGTHGSQPVIVSFCCNRCAYPGVDSAGSEGIQYPASVRVIRSVCAGTIHPNVIVDALTEGADGVLLCGCHPGDCRSREGIHKALARAEGIELLLEDFGLEQVRFRLEHIAASEGPKFAEVVTQMTEELSALGPSPYRQDG